VRHNSINLLVDPDPVVSDRVLRFLQTDFARAYLPMKVIFDAIFLFGPEACIVRLRPKIASAVRASAEFQWNEVVEFVVSQIAAATISCHDLELQTMRPLLGRAHRLRVTRNTDRGPDIVLGNSRVDSARRQLEIWVGILRSGTPMNGRAAYPLMRDWANTTGPMSVMDEETDQQQNDDNNNDSSACHLSRYLPRFASFQKSAHGQKSYPITPPSLPRFFHKC
jgi:hypothetical protein